MSGDSQAVRLPKQFQLHSKRVHIERRGNEIVLRELPLTMAEFMNQLPVVVDWPDASAEGPAEPVQGW
jgi:antitoxin VapB